MCGHGRGRDKKTRGQPKCTILVGTDPGPVLPKDQDQFYHP